MQRHFNTKHFEKAKLQRLRTQLLRARDLGGTPVFDRMRLSRLSEIPEQNCRTGRTLGARRKGAAQWEPRAGQVREGGERGVAGS